jgi:hypothetical protein
VKRFVLVVLGVVLIIAAAFAIVVWRQQAANDAADVEIHRHNDEVRFSPRDLTCAPNWRLFDATLQSALNSSPVTASTSRNGDVVTLTFDNDFQCNRSELQIAFENPHVRRLLAKCSIAKLQCGNVALDLHW